MRRLTTLCLGLLLLSVAFSPSVGASNDPPPAGGTVIGDWVVSDVRSYTGVDLLLDGNLTIAAGGTLTLDGVNLTINSTATTFWNITVQSGGTLRLHDGTIVGPNQSAPHPYYLRALDGSVLDASDSTIAGAGTSLGPLSGELQGVYLGTSGATLDNVTVRDGYSGIVVSSLVGVVAPHLTNCTLRDNAASGLVVALAARPLVDGLQSINNAIGVSILSTVEAADLAGINASDNIIGLRVLGGKVSLRQSTVRDNAIGVLSQPQTLQPDIDLTDVTLRGNLDGTILEGGTLTMSGGGTDAGDEAPLTLGAAASATLVDVSLDQQGIAFNDTDSWVDILWTTFWQTVDDSSGPVANATLQILDAQGAVVLSGTTNATGLLGPLPIRQARRSGGSEALDLNPHLVSAAAPNLRADASLDVDATTTYVVSLLPFDQTAPVVTILTPEHGSAQANRSIELSGSASDNLALEGVEVSLDGSNWTLAIGNASWQAHLLASADGVQQVRARAFDSFGNVGNDTINVTIDTRAPLLEIAAPANRSLTNHTTIAVSGTAEPGAVVALQGVPLSGTAGSWSGFGTLPDEGDNAVEVTASDAVGNVATASVTVIRDTTAATIRLVHPAPGQTLADATVQLEGDADDLVGIAAVRVMPEGEAAIGAALSVDGVPSSGGVGITHPLWRATLTLHPGQNPLVLEVIDAAGNVGHDVASLTFLPADTTEPTLTITNPLPGAEPVEGSIQVQGRATDDRSVRLVEVALGSGPYVPALGTTSWFVTLTLAVGPMTIHARAFDGANNSATTAVDVVVRSGDGEGPTVTITAPLAQQRINGRTVQLVGEAFDPSGVTVVEVTLNGGLPIRAAYANDTGLFVVVLEGLTEGTNLIEVTATDSVGNVGGATVVVVRPAHPREDTQWLLFATAAVALVAVIATIVSFQLRWQASRALTDRQDQMADSRTSSSTNGRPHQARGSDSEE